MGGKDDDYGGEEDSYGEGEVQGGKAKEVESDDEFSFEEFSMQKKGDKEEERKPHGDDIAEENLRTGNYGKKPTAPAGGPPAAATPEVKTENPQSALVMSSSLMSQVLPFYAGGMILNTAQKSARKFYTVEVNMMLKASLNQLASGEVKPILRLKPDVLIFEKPGMNLSGKRTQMHAQGNIVLRGVRSTFPMSIAFLVGENLRGSKAMTVFSHTGVQAAHIALIDDKINYSMAPLLLAQSDIGKFTEEYAESYPKYLDKESMRKSILKVKGNPSKAQVEVGSPVFDAINTAREMLRKENEKKSEADKLDNELLKPLDTDNDHTRTTKFAYANAVEVVKAHEKINRVFDEHVNYVDLYNAFEFPLKPAFASPTESGIRDNLAAWRDLTELEAKRNRSGEMTEEQKEAALNEVHTFHAKIAVEYVPLDNLNKTTKG